ncbi:metallophosphoesterase [Geminocystis sp. NIES-3709]|uniref:metallophosphoesterase n=1 Tax=Geminocystis sp. NIES-3709 TaxID=1617448 RepID=UPI0005FC416F|nr:metallophosphoesterase [Geminocystis sp. NIES-3709]BAQ66482.1 Ser/Thr protein phosphatase family protein [Geminocystis sp. NIES-3709]
MLTLSVLGFLIYIYQIEPQWIEIKNIELSLPNLDQEFVGWKIVQITDIHINDWMTEKRLKNIIELVNKQSPDIVFLTGDFFSQNTTYVERIDGSFVSLEKRKPLSLSKKLLHKLGFIDSEVTTHSFVKDQEILTRTLKKLTPKYKSFSVLGNHDYATDVTLVEQALKDSNIINLKNEIYTFKKNTGILNIAGVDSVSFSKDKLKPILKKLPDKGVNILLVHEPDYAKRSSFTHRFQLQLSGHSHGGQVRIPFFGAPLLPPHGRIYTQGLYKVRDMIQYTNRGVGMAYPYIRFNCRPEITVFTLR